MISRRPAPPARAASSGSADHGQGPLPTAEIAARAALGDLPAAQALLREVWPAMARAVTGVLGASHPDLDDAIQQSSIAFLRALPGFRGECPAAGYASRIALRVALRARRRSKLDTTRR